MACTTIMVGKKASYDGSTMIARNDDSPSGIFHVKKLIVVPPSKQPKTYKSVISKATIALPDNPLPYTATPNVDPSEGIWAASGTNDAGVSMSATETITTNERVLSADPLVESRKVGGKSLPGGFGEEDFVVLVLPYIHSAREGVKRLGEILEKYGTYESNGIAFSDEEEVWWMETIGGHHFIAHRIPDDCYAIAANQFSLDRFDFDDAEGAQKNYMCSKGLREFVIDNSLCLDASTSIKDFDPRHAFGSHTDADHVYNTPRAWYGVTRLSKKTHPELCGKGPEDDDIPFELTPDAKITVNEVKYILASHFQGTPYDPYGKGDDQRKGIYRPIGVNRTAVMCLHKNKKGKEPIQYLAFACNAFNGFVPFFPRVNKIPSYFSNTTMEVSTSSFYWASRLLGALADSHFHSNAIHIERYQEALDARTLEVIVKANREFESKKDRRILEKANEEIERIAKEETAKALDRLLFTSSALMKNGFSRSDK
ncbi:MAG: C69 family dipeptidase [Bacilli bacterium]|nr:C69 family dipeptidase [Bacilli bacterium]